MESPLFWILRHIQDLSSGQETEEVFFLKHLVKKHRGKIKEKLACHETVLWRGGDGRREG